MSMFSGIKLAISVRQITIAAVTVLTGMLCMGSANGEAWPYPEILVCGANGAQNNPQGISDGAGGAIIAWIDLRGSSRAIYAQRINHLGQTQWAEDGIAICSPLTDEFTIPEVISDGAGGAIIGWTDVRNSINGVYAQRISHSGAVLWTANGVAVSPNIGVRYTPKLLSDDSGGAILVWRGYKNSDYNIYAQRVNAAGVRQWGSGDFPIAVTAGYVEECELITDGHGGAIMSWYDRRNGNYDIYAQRVSHAGVRQWALNGIPICTAPMDQADPRITTDGADGAIITWQDFRTGVAYDIYAQRVNSAGTKLWAENGVPVSIAAGRQWLPDIVTDGVGGAYIAWEDSRTPGISLYMQRINSDGLPHWMANGKSIAPNVLQESFTLSTNAMGGAVAAWKDSAIGNAILFFHEVKSSETGSTAPGGFVVAETGTAEAPGLITDPDGQVIVTWSNNLNGYINVYARQLKAPHVPAAAAQWNLYD